MVCLMSIGLHRSREPRVAFLWWRIGTPMMAMAFADADDLMEEGSSVLQTQRSAEPVSKSSFRL